MEVFMILSAIAQRFRSFFSGTNISDSGIDLTRFDGSGNDYEPWRDNNQKNNNVLLEDRVKNNGDSDILKEGDTEPDIYKEDRTLTEQHIKSINVFSEFNDRLKNNNLSDSIYNLMKEIIFSRDKKINSGIDATISYLEGVSVGKSKEELSAINTAKALLKYKKAYQLDGHKGNFESYLLGRNGVLTKKRLRDVQSIKRKFRELIKTKNLREGQKYKVSAKLIGGNESDYFNISYTRSEEPRGNMLHIDYNNSMAIDSDYGEISRKALDKIFSGITGKNVNSFNLINKSINRYIDREVSADRAERVNGKYARFFNREY